MAKASEQFNEGQLGISNSILGLGIQNFELQKKDCLAIVKVSDS